MSIHHLDTFRYWFGTPTRVFASIRPDPRTSKLFPHEDGICLYILEYDNGVRASSWDDVWTGPAREGAQADIGIRWRVEGTEGLALRHASVGRIIPNPRRARSTGPPPGSRVTGSSRAGKRSGFPMRLRGQWPS